MSDFRLVEVHTHDAQAHANSLNAWQQCYEQLSAGPFEARLAELHLGSVQVFVEMANCAMLQHGTPRAGSVALGFVAAHEPSALNWCSGHRLDAGQAVAIAANHGFELVTAAGQCLLGICIDKDALERAALLPDEVSGHAWDRSSAAVLEPDRAAHDKARALIQGAIDLAREQPALLDDPQWCSRLEASLTDALLACFSPAPLQPKLRPGAAARHRIVSRAWAYMHAHADEPISVPQICRAIGVSRRGLQYAFEDALMPSPVNYLRVMRLNRARADIQSRHDERVGDIAARWGFWHLSRFAAEYRKLFGELPSATRRNGAGGACGRPQGIFCQ
jgi:AraC family ethanolamine operon transcriptional activator